jgi:hypothetical protein
MPFPNPGISSRFRDVSDGFGLTGIFDSTRSPGGYALDMRVAVLTTKYRAAVLSLPDIAC